MYTETGVATPVNVEKRGKPLWLVGALTIATFGVYVFVWMALTRLEMERDAEDERGRPIGHVALIALGGIVFFAVDVLPPILRPVGILNLVLLRIHFKRIDELAGPVEWQVAVVGWIAANFLAAIVEAARVRPPLEGLLLLSVGAILGLVVVYGQRALNTYRRECCGSTGLKKVHWIEWVVLALGVGFWALSLLGSAIED